VGDSPAWLPDLIRLPDCGGKWADYVERVYAVFRRDFIESQPQFQGGCVRCRRDPLYDGKETAFWHCIQQGADEEQRTPDLRRCERIGWVRATIENASDPSVEAWPTRRRRDDRMCLWYAEQYLVVLGKRRGYWQLITAYPTDREHTRRKLRREMQRNRQSS
jgi:hypothetical protein